MKPNEYDVIVVGGGIAGICAATSAARHGARTLLVERYGFLGGMSTAGMVTPFMKFWIQNGANERKPLVGGIFEEINRRLFAVGGLVENGFSAIAFKRVAAEMLVASGVEVRLHSLMLAAQTANRRLQKIILPDAAYAAKVFIDTSGDAELVYHAGAPWRKGDEATGHLQAMTMFFRLGGIAVERAVGAVRQNPKNFFAWSTAKYDPDKIISIAGYFDLVKKAQAEKRLQENLEYFFFTSLPAYGEAAFNTTNILGLDGSSSFDLTKAEIEGRRQVFAVFKILREEAPGFENSYLIETGVQVGVRETRRAVGDYLVTGDDVISGRKFPEAIARACYGIDIHAQKGESSRMEHLPEGQYYEIPLGAIIVKDVDNLLVAGRCISSTREGHAALRIQATSAAVGEAAGLLAALSARGNGDVRAVPYRDLREPLRKIGNV